MNTLKISCAFAVVFLYLAGAAFSAGDVVRGDEDHLGANFGSAELTSRELTLPGEDREKLLAAKASGAPYILIYGQVSFSLGLPGFVPDQRDYSDLSQLKSGAGYGFAGNIYCIELHNGARVQVFEDANFQGNSMGLVRQGVNFLGDFGEKAASIKWITEEMSRDYFAVPDHPDEGQLGAAPEPLALKQGDFIFPGQDREKMLSAQASGAPFMVVWDYYSWIYGYPPPLIAPGPRDFNDLSHYWTPFGYLGDHVEYIELHNGGKVAVYEHANFQGNFMVLNKQFSALGGFGREASSIRWITNDEPPGPYVIFYEHHNYQGRSLRVDFPIDMNCLKNTPYGNMDNRISSFRIFNGGAICVFKRPHFGAGKVFTGDVADLKVSSPDYQDTISGVTWQHSLMGY